MSQTTLARIAWEDAQATESETATTPYSCVGCNRPSPRRDLNTPLISTHFGWRLARRILPDGSTAAEWRCGHCWNEHKRKTGASIAPPTASIPPPRIP